jgi:tetratricopeptide (TPR) repeat protein
MNDLDALLQLGDAARERKPEALPALRRFVGRIHDPAVLLDGAAQFEEDEPTAGLMLTRVIALAPRNVRAWEDLAALYIRHDPGARRLRTRSALRRVLKLDPENIFAMRLKLRALERRRSHRRAIRLARALVRRDPLLVEAMVVLARVLAKDGYFDAAILELRRFKERVSTPDPAYAAWLIAEAEEAELALRSPCGA